MGFTTAPASRWSDCIVAGRGRPRDSSAASVGVVDGEGCGPEIVRAALAVLEALAAEGAVRATVRRAPVDAAAAGGTLGEGLAAFCADVFAEGGALLCGPVGGRFVYELRARFDLFCKLVPLRPIPALGAAGPLRPEHLAGVDVLLVRENAAGVYQGYWSERRDPAGGRRAEHAFSYTEREVRRIVDAAVCLARRRRGRLAVVLKDGGVPSISGLWRDVAAAAAGAAGVTAAFVNIDLAAYRLVQEPATLDVIVAPNLFGDVLADVGAVLLGGRAHSFSGNFAAGGAAVYQTNHGAAADLAGTDRANPVGQILSLAMLLRESAGLDAAADWVERAVADTWGAGWRTAEAAAGGWRVIGTREMGLRIADAAARLAREGQSGAAGAAAD